MCVCRHAGNAGVGRSAEALQARLDIFRFNRFEQIMSRAHHKGFFRVAIFCRHKGKGNMHRLQLPDEQEWLRFRYGEFYECQINLFHLAIYPGCINIVENADIADVGNFLCCILKFFLMGFTVVNVDYLHGFVFYVLCFSVIKSLFASSRAQFRMNNVTSLPHHASLVAVELLLMPYTVQYSFRMKESESAIRKSADIALVLRIADISCTIILFWLWRRSVLCLASLGVSAGFLLPK